LVRDAARRHRVQERCAVWLRLAPDGWVIDAPTLDGYPLEGFDDGPGNDACPCPDPRECEALRSAAALLPLPTAEDLIVLLREATALSGPHEGVGPDGSGTWSGQDQPPRGGPEPAWALVRDAARRHAVTERSVLRLRLTPHGWALHPAALEMGPLPGYPCGPLTEECECADPAECAALRRAAALLARPDARDLLALLEQTQ
jgi:hypothetical protein